MATASGVLLAGRYRTVERLGAGGMATVYLAEDERLGRQVAVKRLHAESPQDMGERFAREARVGASLNHPNVVSVYDTVTDEDGVLIVMEYVEGPTFGQALADGQLSRERALRVLEGVAAALDHVHEGGVVHRDVKPANVLIRPDGTVKLTDLGIATASEGTQITGTGTVLGTPSYMAPEQLEGGAMGPAVDVYALAAMAFEALGGRKARTGRTPVEIAHRATTEPPPDLREAWTEAPAEAAELLARGMDRDPAVRPSSAGALVRDLERALDMGAGAPGEVGDAISRGGLGGAAAGVGSALTQRLRGSGAGAVEPGPETAESRTVHGDPETPGRSWRRRLTVLAVGGALLAAGAVALASSSDEDAPAPPSARRAPARVAPPEPKPRTPDQTVGDFYQLSVADDFRGAWRLAGSGYRAQLQGFESYKATFDSLRDIEFRRLKTTSEEDSSATVAIRTVARHTDRTDRCQGTYDLSRVRESADWRIDSQALTCSSGGPSSSGGSAGSGASEGGGAGSDAGEAGKAKKPKDAAGKE